MVAKTWRTEAKRRWGKKAEWIQGDGQFALLAWCGVLTVTLWKTKDEAERQKKVMPILLTPNKRGRIRHTTTLEVSYGLGINCDLGSREGCRMDRD